MNTVYAFLFCSILFHIVSLGDESFNVVHNKTIFPTFLDDRSKVDFDHRVKYQTNHQFQVVV
jgi:hypothetical protein